MACPVGERFPFGKGFMDLNNGGVEMVAELRQMSNESMEVHLLTAILEELRIANEKQVVAESFGLTLNAEEAARLLGVTKSKIYQMCQTEPDFPYFQCPDKPGASVFISRDALVEWVNKKTEMQLKVSQKLV